MDKKWLITLGSLTLAAATTATVSAFILTSDPASDEEKELAGVHEPAFQGTEPAFSQPPAGAGATTGNPNDGVAITRDGGSRVEVPIGRHDQDGPKDGTDKTGGVPTIDPVPEPLVREDEGAPSMGMPVPGYTGVDTVVVIDKDAIPQPEPLPTFESMMVFQMAQSELSQRLGIDKDSIKLATTEKLTWSDASLGNPEPGMSYAEVLVPGFKLALVTPGGPTFYIYHTSMEQVVFFEAVEAAEYKAGQLTHGDPGQPTGDSHGKVIPVDKLTEVFSRSSNIGAGPAIEVEPVLVPAPETEPSSQEGTSVAGYRPRDISASVHDGLGNDPEADHRVQHHKRQHGVLTPDGDRPARENA